MTTTQTEEPPPRKPLRLWPGVVIVALQWLVRFGVPVVAPDAMLYGVLGGLLGGVALVVWWAFFSRAPRPERFGAVVLMAVALFATSRAAHVSIATGTQGMLLALLATPVLSLAFVVWAAASRRLADAPRRATMVATILLACGVWTLVRTGGINSNFDNELMWRWAKDPEERLLAQAVDEPAAKSPDQPVPSAPVSGETPKDRLAAPAVQQPPPAAAGTGAGWPGFRGPDRDGVVRGVRIKTGWTASPPVELWRRPVGPGWSSFAVGGDFFYTQEQRGQDEIVACYNVMTGKPVWRHRDAARFWESNAGAGPRGTPALSNGRIYTLGATGIVNALDARNGAVVWSRNAASDTEAARPDWGFSGSPLVVGDAVIVAASGKLAAYDLATGNPRWVGPAGGAGYSSPHLLTIDGVPQVLLLSAIGATSVALADGVLLWRHQWKGHPIVQPALTAEGDILISVSESSGTRRLAVAHGQAGWTVEERWTSNGLKPYFNDFIVHKGHAFGFDGRILSCIDLADGTRKWKGGRFGQGQLILLPAQDLLLVLSEEGELALVSATSGQFTELARRPAIQGKTWNHPVLAGGVLLVRNAEEMAAFRLALEDR
jgi:outer membrane protein assembly factor BamB